MENGKKFFEGVIAKNIDKAQRLKEKLSKDTLTEKEKASMDKTLKLLKQSLDDFANFNMAISIIEEAMQPENEEQREAALDQAYEQSIQHLGKIKNKEFHHLFTGTLKEQLGALNKANQQYVDMTPKKYELEASAKLKALKVNHQLSQANATLDVALKSDASEVDDTTIDQLLNHGAVPKTLNFPVSKLDGSQESIEVSLTNTKGYYKKHKKMPTTPEQKAEVLNLKIEEKKNKFMNSVFGKPAQILAVQKNMKKTREARHELPDHILEGKSLLKQLEEVNKAPPPSSFVSKITPSKPPLERG